MARNEPLLAELRNHFGSMMHLAHEEKPTARLRLPSYESSAELWNPLALTKGIAKTTLP